jgi:hypothetical protein
VNASDAIVTRIIGQSLDKGTPIIEALLDTAAQVNVPYPKVAKIWEAHVGMPPEQQLRIDFLSKDHGEPVLSCLLPRHDLWSGRGDILAVFPSGFTFRILYDGRFSPVEL